MRTDLSPAFLAELENPDRQPRLLVEFHFADQIRYLSDQVVGTDDGLDRDYEPIIEDWGDMRDNVRIEPVVEGESLETRQLTFRIINIGDPPFAQHFKDENPENIKVYIYQWFANLDPAEMALIDVFICQDPITTNEATAIVSIQTVSPIMANNNFIWGPNKTIAVRFPLVVGKINAVAQPMDTGPTGWIVYDMDASFTGELFIDLGSNTDFPETGFIFIDSEQLAYDSFNVTKFNITGRGQNGTTARPHIRGAMVTNPSAQYDYSMSAGPVESIDNLLADGEEYVNPVTILSGQDPAILRFEGRPPWHRVEEGGETPPIVPDPETTTQYGSSSETYAEVVSAPASPGNINNSGSNVVMSFDDSIDGSSSKYEDGAITRHEPSYAVGSFDAWSDGYILCSQPEANMLPDGETMYMEGEFGRDLSSLGTFISATVKLDLIMQVRNSTGNAKVYIDGVLDEFEDDITNRASFSHNPSTSWSPYSSATYVDVGITSWSELQNLVVRCEWIRNDDYYKGDMKFSISMDLNVKITYQTAITPTYPVQEVVSHFNRDLSSLGAFISAEVTVRFDLAATNATMWQGIVTRTSNNPNDNSTLWSRQVSSAQSMANQVVYPSIGSMATLKNMRVGVRQELISPASAGDRRTVTCNVAYVVWAITYQPGAIDQADETRVIYVTELIADVTSQNGSETTPANAIENLVSTVGGLGDMIDRTSFDQMDADYRAAGFFFNGLIDGAMLFHDAVKLLCRQGMARLVYNGGKIKLVSNFISGMTPVLTANPYAAFEKTLQQQIEDRADDNTPDLYIYKKDQRQRSVTEQRMRFDDVKNKLTLRFAPNPQFTEWEGEVEVSDQESIASIGEQQTSYDYPLIRDETVIQQLADRLLELKGTPQAFTVFTCYLPAFVVEKSDQVFVETDFNDYSAVVGPVLTANRIFGPGKSNKFNAIQLTVLSFPVVAHQLSIEDGIQVNDDLDLAAVLSIDLNINETVNVNETYDNEVQFTVSLDINEQVLLDDTVDKLQGVIVTLDIEDAVDIASDDISFESVVPIELDLSDGIQIAEDVSSAVHQQFELLVEESIGVYAAVDSLDVVSGGYGTTGYGMDGYGGGSIGIAAGFKVYHKTDFVIYGGDEVIFY